MVKSSVDTASVSILNKVTTCIFHISYHSHTLVVFILHLSSKELRMLARFWTTCIITVQNKTLGTSASSCRRGRWGWKEEGQPQNSHLRTGKSSSFDGFIAALGVDRGKKSTRIKTNESTEFLNLQ